MRGSRASLFPRGLCCAPAQRGNLVAHVCQAARLLRAAQNLTGAAAQIAAANLRWAFAPLTPQEVEGARVLASLPTWRGEDL